MFLFGDIHTRDLAPEQVAVGSVGTVQSHTAGGVEVGRLAPYHQELRSLTLDLKGVVRFGYFGHAARKVVRVELGEAGKRLVKMLALGQNNTIKI